MTDRDTSGTGSFNQDQGEGIYRRFALGPSSASLPPVPASSTGPTGQCVDGNAGKTPHDLEPRISGLAALRHQTQGDPAVTIVILDGTPDLSVSSLSTGLISKEMPYWHNRVAPLSHADHALFREIAESDMPDKVKDARFLASFSNAKLFRFLGDRHATHITSIIAGQAGTPVSGLAPGCRVIVIPLNEMGDPAEYFSALNLSRAFDLANDLGADIIHCAACLPTQTDAPDALLAHAVEKCLRRNTLIVAPAGNDAGECRCFPAVLPGTLAVGALKDSGQPFKFSNFGGNYSTEGIMAPGENILGAQPGTEAPIREMGTSVAAPVVTGIAALLMSRQLQLGRQIDAAAILKSMLKTARPCLPAADGKPERGLSGALDLRACLTNLFSQSGAPAAQGGTVAGEDDAGNDRARLVPAGLDQKDQTGPDQAPTAAAGAALPQQQPMLKPSARADSLQSPDVVAPSTAHSGLVYVIGGLGFDFGSSTVLQDFEQFMRQSAPGEFKQGCDPHQVTDLVEFLAQNPTARQRLVWILLADGAPLYALKPTGPNVEEIYDTLLHLLAGQSLEPENDSFVERISIPGRRSDTRVALLSGERLPQLDLSDLRGIYGWHINAMVDDAVDQIFPREDPQRAPFHGMLLSFLNRVYFDLQNLGQTSRDRAMNFAATNCFQAAAVFAQALSEQRVLDRLEVQKSPLCRLHSDCWDMSLTFVDPSNLRRAGKIFQFTIDVSETLPVTVGTVKSWVFRRR